MIRTISIYAALLVGLVLTFTGFFAGMAALYLFWGTAAAVLFFITVSTAAVVGLSALFLDDRLPEDDWQQVCAQEGANVVSLRGRG